MFIRLPRRLPSRLSHLAMIAVVAFSCALLFACKSAPPPPQTAEAPQQPRGNPDEPTKDIPSDLFKSMPIFPGAEVTHVHKPKGAMREITFSTSGQLNQIVDFYKEQLKANNFHITSSLIMPARRTWSCDFHKNGRPATIMLYPSDKDKSKLTIDLIYELPAKPDSGITEVQENFDVVGPGPVAQQATNSNEKTKRN
jgi:hypothetical protein